MFVCRQPYGFDKQTNNDNNIYINDNVGKCNRLDKCGYHYTPKQYFTDNPWLAKSVRTFEDIGFTNVRTTHKPQPTTITPLPRWFMEQGFLNRVGADAPLIGREQSSLSRAELKLLDIYQAKRPMKRSARKSEAPDQGRQPAL